MPMDLTDNLLFMMKEYYARFGVDVRNLQPKFWDRIETSKVAKYDSGGKYFTWPAEMEGGESVGAYRESGVLPGGPDGSIELKGDQPRVKPKLYAFTHRFSGLSRAAIKQGPEGFFNSVDHAIKKKTMICRNDQNRQCYGNGKGVLGTLAALPVVAAGKSTLTFDSTTNMQYFARTQRIDIWDPTLATRRKINSAVATNNTSEDVGWPIESVNRAARQIVVTGDVNAGAGAEDPAVGDVVIRENVGIGVNSAPITAAEGNEITGLRALVQDGGESTTLQNLAFATWPEWAATVLSAGGALRPITEDLLQNGLDEAETASGEEVEMILSNKGQRRMLIRIGLAQVRQVATQLKLGYQIITWNGKALFVDRHFPFNMMLLIKESNLMKVVVKEWGSLDTTSRGERLEHRDAYELAFGGYCNIAVKRGNPGVRLNDLQEP